MDSGLITLKGTGDGIKLYLDAKAPFSDILTAVSKKIEAWRDFFGAGHCHMYFLGREIDKVEMIRLEKVVKDLLPESIIVYDQKNVEDTVQLPAQFLEKINQTRHEQKADVKPEPELKNENKADEKDETPVNEELQELVRAKDVITNHYKSNRARLYEGTVKAGQVVEADGHMILVGDVLKGGTVIATGKIIVLGSLLGSAQAGCMGNAESYIVALNMEPTDLRIAHANKKYYDGEFTKDFIAKKAYLTKDEIFIEQFLSNI